MNYVPAETKGISIEEYQALASDILDDPGSVSLQDIRGVVDAADASVETQQGVIGTSINDLFAGNRPVPVEEPAEVTVAGDKVKLKSAVDELFVDEPILTDVVVPAEVVQEMMKDELPAVPVEVVVNAPAADPELTSKAILGPEDMSIDESFVEMVEGDTGISEESLKVDIQPGAQPNVWKILPDGSAVLEQIEG